MNKQDYKDYVFHLSDVDLIDEYLHCRDNTSQNKGTDRNRLTQEERLRIIEIELCYRRIDI